MSIATKNVERVLGPGGQRLGVDDPVDPGQRVRLVCERGCLDQAGKIAGESEFCICARGSQLLKEHLTEAAGAQGPAEGHPAAVDVGELETDHFGRAQPGRKGRGQCDMMLQVRHRPEEALHLLDTERNR